MLIDVAIHPFGADVARMVEFARTSESIGLSGVWVADHFAAAMVGQGWSRDPFVSLGAIAVSTERIDLGILVANVVNRHPAQLVSAVNSLQSLAGDRVRLGVGSGAAPGSRFAVEHEAIGRTLGSADERRRMLVDHIAAIRAIFAGTASFQPSFESSTVRFDGLDGVVDGTACPEIVVGASSWPTVELALRHADGVNLRRTASTSDHLAALDEHRPAGFEVSVLDGFDSVAADPGLVDRLEDMGVDRLIVGVSAPHDRDRLDVIGQLVARRDRRSPLR